MASLTSRRSPSAKPEEQSVVRSCKTVLKSSESKWLVMCVFLLVVFVAPQQETTLTSPRRTSRKPLPGPAALSSLCSLSLRRPRKGQPVRKEPNYRTNFTPAHDFGDAAGTDALDVHSGDSGFEGAFTAGALLEQRSGKDGVALTDLGDGKVEGADSGLKAAWFEAVGIAITRNASLVRRGTDVGFAFE